MTGRGSRLALWGVALLLCLSLFLRGRVPTQTAGIAPFFHSRDGRITVRLAGDFPRPGIYRIPGGATPQSVIKMALAAPCPALRLSGRQVTVLSSGDILTLSRRAPQRADLSISDMGAGERMALGIPLDPDRMREEDWLALPGIGPVLARRIVADRQRNGAFGGVDGLMRVDGVGPGKVRLIKRYF